MNYSMRNCQARIGEIPRSAEICDGTPATTAASRFNAVTYVKKCPEKIEAAAQDPNSFDDSGPPCRSIATAKPEQSGLHHLVKGGSQIVGRCLNGSPRRHLNQRA